MVQEQPITAEERLRAALEPEIPVAEAASPVVAEAVTPAVADFDLSTPAGIRALADKYPELKNWREEGYGAGLEAGKQRTLADIQRDKGTEESVRAYHQRVIDAINAGEDPDELVKETPTYVRANREIAKIEAMRALAMDAKSMAGSEAEANMLQALIDEADGSAEKMERAAGLAIQTVTKKARADALDELTLDELLKNDKHRSAIEAEVERRLAEEQAARDVESNRLVAPPDAPPGSLGGPSGMTIDRWLQMTPDARKTYALSQDDAGREALWEMVGANMGR